MTVALNVFDGSILLIDDFDVPLTTVPVRLVERAPNRWMTDVEGIKLRNNDTRHWRIARAAITSPKSGKLLNLPIPAFTLSAGEDLTLALGKEWYVDTRT